MGLLFVSLSECASSPLVNLPSAKNAAVYHEEFRELRTGDADTAELPHVDAQGRWLLELDRDRPWSSICSSLEPIWQSRLEPDLYGYLVVVAATEQARGVFPFGRPEIRGISFAWAPAWRLGDPPDEPATLSAGVDGGVRFDGEALTDVRAVSLMRIWLQGRANKQLRLALAPEERWGTAIHLADLAWEAGAAWVVLPPCGGWSYDLLAPL
jgi:hypothetical protein